jgi:hypothetical protein
MVSRKTYFGIGWPRDPAGPESAAPKDADSDSDSDEEDRSAPTVDNDRVDDDRAPEGLRELRSWYQSDAPEQPAPIDTSAPAQPEVVPPSGLRPTAVGHASSDVPAPPRPYVPDPMRATMFGHQIHRFDLEAPPAAADLPPATTPAPSPRGGATHGGASADAPRRPPAASPQAPGWGPAPAQADALRLADYVRRQAAQPHPPVAAWVPPVDNTEERPTWRAPIVVLVAGIVALTWAVVLAIRTRDIPIATAPAPPSTAIDRTPAPLGAPAPSNLGRTRNPVPAQPAPVKVERAPRSPEASQRPRPPKVEAKAPAEAATPPVAGRPRASDEAASATRADSSEGERTTTPAEPKDKKPRDTAPVGGTESTQPPPLGP